MNQALADYLESLPPRPGTKIPYPADLMRILRHPWFSEWIADLDLSPEAAIFIAGWLLRPDGWQTSLRFYRKHHPKLMQELETKKALRKFRHWRRDGSVRAWEKKGSAR
jgi:hypothetical protein